MQTKVAPSDSPKSVTSSVNDISELLTSCNLIRDVPLPGGKTICLKIPSLGKIRDIGKRFPPALHFAAMACECWVDELGDSILPTSEDGCMQLDALDGPIGEAIIGAVKAFCLNSIDYEALAKNWQATRGV